MLFLLACVAQEPVIPPDVPSQSPEKTASPEAPPVPDVLEAPLVEAPADGWVVAGLLGLTKRAKRCQRTIADKIPDIQGTVVIDFTLEEGRVTSATLASDDSKNQHLGRCVQQQLKNAGEFSPHASGAFQATWRFGPIPPRQ